MNLQIIFSVYYSNVMTFFSFRHTTMKQQEKEGRKSAKTTQDIKHYEVLRRLKCVQCYRPDKKRVRRKGMSVSADEYKKDLVKMFITTTGKNSYSQG